MSSPSHEAIPGASGVRALRRFVAPPAERCDFCRQSLPSRHAHLVETDALRLLCVCPDCEGRMAAPEAGRRRVAPRCEPLEDVAITDAQWAGLQIPVGMAFLLRPEPGGAPTALFPGPAGATRSELGAEAWADLVASCALLGELEPGAEALLVDRTRGRRAHFRLSIDHCFALTGLLRSRWRGLAGGEEAWAAADDYLDGQGAAGRSAVHA